MAWALTFAAVNAGNNIAARMAIMAITTKSSISVKPRRVIDREEIRSEPVLPVNLMLFSRISDLLLEPIKLAGINDGIGHDILSTDDGR